MTTDSIADLSGLAKGFAIDLTNTLNAVVPGTPPFRVSVAGSESEARAFVRQEETEGIVLTVDSEPLLRLAVEYRCALDHRERYLAVVSSWVKVFVVSATDPLMRFEFVRAPDSTQASAHVQVHAHRDEFTWVMMRCGNGSRRAKRRAKSAESRVPRLSDLHLPVGGSRFRPCLEDVLQMLIDEFGVDAPSGAHAALEEGRKDWRLKQLGAAVRDSPRTAAATLTEMGYLVTAPLEEPADRDDRLTEA